MLHLRLLYKFCGIHYVGSTFDRIRLKSFAEQLQKVPK